MVLNRQQLDVIEMLLIFIQPAMYLYSEILFDVDMFDIILLQGLCVRKFMRILEQIFNEYCDRWFLFYISCSLGNFSIF